MISVTPETANEENRQSRSQYYIFSVWPRIINASVNNKKQLFDRWAPSYDWLFPSVFYQAIHKPLLEYVNLPEPSNVLDLGYGTGCLLNSLATHFPHLRSTGLDFSPEMLRQARCRNRYPTRLIYVQGNAEALPFADYPL